jgi:F-type H+-transporting ATPase subunit delta
MSIAVANQYAKALLDVVLKPGSRLAAEEALVQLQRFRDALGISSELRELLMTPAVSHELKLKALTRLASMMDLHPTIVNFLSVVKNHRRVQLMDEICRVYRAQLDDRLGVARALVRSARALGEQEREKLLWQLRLATGKRVECEYTVDSELVGGITVTIGSTIYDGSVRGRLDGLKRRLTSEG